MKKILTTLASCALLILAACSSSNTPVYNAETVQSLMEKCQNGAELTQEEFSEMIDQCDAISSFFNEINPDESLTEEEKKDAMTKILAQDDNMEKLSELLSMGVYLDMYRDHLDAANLKKLEALEARNRASQD